MSRPELPPLRLKTFVPDAAIELQGRLEKLDAQLPTTVICPQTSHPLGLQTLRLDWPVEGMTFYVGPVPGYADELCHLTYVPETILSQVEGCIRSGQEEIGQTPDFKAPESIRPI